MFETKYWLNRALVRDLMKTEEVKSYATQLSDVARQLNTFANSLKSQRSENKAQSKSIREPQADYIISDWIDGIIPLLTEDELNWLES